MQVAAAYANYKTPRMLMSRGDPLISAPNRNFESPLHYDFIFGSPSGKLEILRERAWGLHDGYGMHPGVRYATVTLAGELPEGKALERLAPRRESERRERGDRRVSEMWAKGSGQGILDHMCRRGRPGPGTPRGGLRKSL